MSHPLLSPFNHSMFSSLVFSSPLSQGWLQSGVVTLLLMFGIWGEGSLVHAEAEQPPYVSAPASAPAIDESAVKQRIRASLPDNEVVGIEPSAISNLYQVDMRSGEIFYITQDAQYLLSGDLMKIVPGTGEEAGRLGVINLTEAHRSKKRTQLLTTLQKRHLITYPAKGKVRGELFAFTDTDCIYCRKFHDEIPKLTAMGFEVSYLAWPRAGVHSSTGKDMVNIWCAKDSQKAMDKAKGGARVAGVKGDVKRCEKIVGAHRVLGEQLGVRGTPAVFLRDGRQIGGYLRAEQVAQYFQKQ